MSDSRCKCSMGISLNGEGCRYCQPQTLIDMLKEHLHEADEENEQLRARVAELEVTAMAVVNDLRMRAEPDSDGIPVVNCSDSKYAALCEVLADKAGGSDE